MPNQILLYPGSFLYLCRYACDSNRQKQILQMLSFNLFNRYANSQHYCTLHKKLYWGPSTLVSCHATVVMAYIKNKNLSLLKIYFVHPNLKIWQRACWYIAIKAVIKNCGSVTSKRLSNRSDRRQGIINVNERYYAAMNPYWTIVPLLEHLVVKQQHVPGSSIKRILKKQKNMIYIFGSASLAWSILWYWLTFPLKGSKHFTNFMSILK